MATAEDILGKAIEVIQRDGWCQNTLATTDGKVCAIGAMTVACQELRIQQSCDEYLTAMDRMAGIIHAGMVGITHASIPHWNDDPSRTQEDVILAFKKAMESK